MASQTSYIVQTFEIHRKRLVPTVRAQFKTEQQAIRSAESTAQRKTGSAAMKVIADDETGEMSSIEVIAKYGEVPDDFEELLQG
ncbi:hypothetical protein [Microvirga sp. P5_D2]